MDQPTRDQSIEVRRLLERFSGAAGAFPFREDGEDRPVNYLYREGSTLVLEQDAGRVRHELEQLNLNHAEDDEPLSDRYEGRVRTPGEVPVVPGAVRLTWVERGGDARVPVVLDALDARLGAGVARPDHLLVVASHPCPATEPELSTSNTPFPAPVEGCGCHGGKAVVSIVDTGLAPNATNHPWLTGVTGDVDQLITGRTIDLYGGHGTFVAGTLRAMAPGAIVSVQGSLTITRDGVPLSSAGAAFESDVAEQCVQALNSDPDVMVLTFATESRKHLSLLGFDAAFQYSLRHAKGLVFLAPAGNAGNNVRQWPAAYDWVLSVGALSRNWRTRAGFSGYGPWVDVYAPGEDLINAYADGNYTYLEQTHVPASQAFSGMAVWSGTSFSTPLVAGLIAARVGATGLSGRQAADSLLRVAEAQALPGVGAVLYPGQVCCHMTCGNDCASGCCHRRGSP